MRQAPNRWLPEEVEAAIMVMPRRLTPECRLGMQDSPLYRPAVLPSCVYLIKQLVPRGSCEDDTGHVFPTLLPHLSVHGNMVDHPTTCGAVPARHQCTVLVSFVHTYLSVHVSCHTTCDALFYPLHG
ncbi:hypothetical protein J6590_044120 [Homalodisca vitripennis]|nr:hypothetical protein J6590_044120 [Homalodisca vitripennis]